MSTALNNQKLKSRRIFTYSGLFIVSSLLILLRLWFYSDDFYLSPQSIPSEFDGKSMLDVRQYLMEFSLGSFKYDAFRLFFIVDLAFPILLFGSAMLTLGNKIRSFVFMGVTAVLAVLASALENFSFLLYDFSVETVGTLQDIKIYAYGAFFIVWLYQVYKQFLQGKITLFLKALIASSLSLIIVVIFAVLMTNMDQGTSLVIELLSSPFNFLLFLSLTVFCTIIISHYPIFIYQFFFPSSNYQWRLNYRLKIFPVVYFNSTENHFKSLQNIKHDLIRLQSNKGLYDQASGLLEMQLFHQLPGDTIETKESIETIRKSKISIEEDLTEDHKNYNDLLKELERVVKEIYSDRIIKFVRHYLGSFLYLAIIYILLFTYLKVFWQKPGTYATQMVFNLGILIFAFQWYLFNRRESIRDYKHEEVDQKLSRVKLFFFIFNFLLVIQAGLIILRLVAVADWSSFNVLLGILQMGLALVTYVFFREFRSVFKFRYGLHPAYSTKTGTEDPIIKDSDRIVHHLLNKTYLTNLTKYVPYLGNLSNNEFFILLSIIFNIIIALIIIYFSVFEITSLNAANYLLTYLILYYGMIIFILKSIFYYERNNIDENDKSLLNKFTGIKVRPVWVSYISLLALVFGIVGFSSGNDLHKLKAIEHKLDDHLSLSDFRESIPTKYSTYSTDSISAKSIFTVSSFGGGLKANYYTLRLLEKIQKETDNRFLEGTVSMSGVSGGGVGLANYYLLDGYTDGKDINRKITEIGQLNVLGIDCSYLMFQDFWREVFSVFSFKYTDRSWRGMREYKSIILDDVDNFDLFSYQDIHLKIIEKKGYYPNLIMNTTSTKLEYGIAQSVSKLALPGAIDILDIQAHKGATWKEQSLNFYDAVSTVNRFPIFSPAAEIDYKGHFVDGGYFENSGMLSTLSFLDRLGKGRWAVHEKMELPLGERQVVMINFINSRQHWIHHLLQEFYDSENIISAGKETTELSAIINTVTGTEMLPNYFIDLLKTKARDSLSELQFIPIYMPYFIDYSQIVSELKGEPIRAEELIEFLRAKNKEIEIALQNDTAYDRDVWGIVEPALSRNLSEQDRIYQDVMIRNHPYIQGQIEKIRKNL